MRQIIISLILINSSIALAEPSEYRANCLTSMSEREFGLSKSNVGKRKYQAGNALHINTKDGLGKSLHLEKSGYYTWDGEGLYYQPFKLVSLEPQADTKDIWTVKKFNQDQDGRIPGFPQEGKKISFKDLKAIQSLFISLSMASMPKEINELKKKEDKDRDAKVLMLDKIYAACADVTDVKLQDEKTVADTSAKARALLRKEFPKAFASDSANSSVKDGAGRK